VRPMMMIGRLVAFGGAERWMIGLLKKKNELADEQRHRACAPRLTAEARVPILARGRTEPRTKLCGVVCGRC